VASNQLVKKQIGSFTIWLVGQFADSPLQNALSEGYRSLDKIYSLDNIPASKFADVYKFTYAQDKSKPVLYFKQYHYRSVWDFAKHVFRRSRAERTMRANAMLDDNGFAFPLIVAIGYRRKGPFRAESFLLTREVENALPVHSFLQSHFSTSKSLRIKRDFILALGRFIGRLHTKNISHGDLRLGNVLVRQNGSNWDFFLLDNERTIQYARLPDHLRLKNLVQVNMFRPPLLTNTDRLRFFKAYLSENPHLIPEWKSWAAKVQRKTARRLLRHPK
jgi:serine/threonine protein kinase